MRSEPSLAVAPSAVPADLVVIGLFGCEKITTEKFFMNLSLSQDVKESLVAVANDFEQVFHNANRVGATTPVVRTGSIRYTLLGLGVEEHPNNFGCWGGGIGLRIGAGLSRLVHQEKGCTSLAFHLPSSLLVHQVVRDITQSFFHGLYSDNRYRTGDNVRRPAKDLKQMHLCPFTLFKPANYDAVQSYIDEGIALAQGQYLAMDIVNAPHNVLNSLSLANEARELAALNPGLECRILDKNACEQRGMGAFLGVARGSETEPQFIHIIYRPTGAVQTCKKIGVVGKGLLFDTGGYNIKTSMMELMKFDCGGAAAVFGAARAIATLKPKGVEVHFIVAACENMIGPKAFVASDVLTASNGKTIEVVNTDAEGRLTLADALVYADKEVGCESIIELSTLTGSCMVSLGKQICGIWTTNHQMAADLEAASKASGEKSWRMPMAMEYRDQLDSMIADYKNCGTRYGGAITAALFLHAFVAEDKAFAHVDIAGPVWDDKLGATGFGVKLITEWISAEATRAQREATTGMVRPGARTA